MTLIAGIVCDDGVILAADSANTDMDAGTKQPVEKIKRLGEHKILYGRSGDAGLLQKIDDALQGCPHRDVMKRFRQELKARIVPEQQEAVRFHAPYPAQGFNRPPEAILLFAGIVGGQPTLLEIEKDGRDTVYGKDMGNFAAVGSGKPWAQAIFRPFLYTPRNLELGKVFAYRVMVDAIALASGLIAEPVRIWVIPVNGEITQVEAVEMERLLHQREMWREMEEEAVGRLLRPRPAPEPEPTLPAPEAAG